MGNSLALTIKLDADGNLVGKLNQASQSVDSFSKEINQAKSASDRLSDRLTDMSHLAISAFSLNGIYDFHKQLLATTAQLESMGKAYGAIFGKSQASDQIDWVTSVANQMGLSLMDAAEQFKQFSASTRNTALEGEHTRAIFMATASAAATLGLSTESTNRAFLAMSQMASKGTVSMEELRGQLGEAIPGAMNMAADAMGVSVQELDKMVSSGQVLSSELLPKLADEMQKMYGASANGANNLTAELNRLDSATMSLGAAYTSGWSDDATAIIHDMTQFFTDPSVISGARSMGVAVGDMMRTIAENKETVLTVSGALIGLMRGGFVGGAVGAVGGFAFSQIINDTDVQRIKELKHDLESLKPNATNWSLVDQQRANMQSELAYLEEWANVSKSTYKVVYDTAAKAEADKTASALSEAKKRSMIASGAYDEWAKSIDDLNKYDFEQRKKSLSDYESSERKRVELAKKAASDILQAKKRAQDEDYDYFEKNLQSQEKAQQDYQKSVSDVFEQVRRELDPTIDLYDAYNKKVQAVQFSTVSGSAEQQAMLEKLKASLEKQLNDLRDKNDVTANAVRVAWEQSVKRLDDAFANVWRDIFDGASDFGSSLKRWFTSLLAELAHAAITKPIVISMTGALGIGGSASAMASTGGLLGNAGSLLGSAGGFLGQGLSSVMGGISGMSASWSTSMLNISEGFWMEGLSQAMGTALPVIGAALAIDSLTGGSISTGIMGGARGERGRSLDIGIQNGQVSESSNIYRATHYDAGWGRSGDWNVDNIGGASFNKSIKDTVDAMANSIKSNAEKLGLAFNQGFSGHFGADLFQKSAEETQKIIADTFASIGNAMANSVQGLPELISPMQKSGEQLYDTLSRVLNQFDAFNQPIGRLNDSLSVLSGSTLKAVDALINATGSMQTLAALQSNFINDFYSSAQKFDITSKTVTGVFDAIGMMAPQSADSLVSLVKSLDLTTESGRKAYVTITSNSTLLKQYYDTISSSSDALIKSIDAQKSSVESLYSAYKSQSFALEVKLLNLAGDAQGALNLQREKELAAMDASLQAVQKNVWALEDQKAALDKLKSTASTAFSSFDNLSKSIKAFIASLAIGLSGTGASYASQLTLAQGGNQDALGGITQTAGSYLETSRANASSLADYNRIQAMVVRDLSALPEVISPYKQLSSDITNAISNQTLTYGQAIGELITVSGQSMTIEQFKQAFSGTATDAQLSTLFASLDTNLDGVISATEAVNATTGNVDDNTTGIQAEAQKQLTSLLALNESTLKQVSGQISLNNTMLSLKDAVYALGVTQAEQLRIEQERIAKEQAESQRVSKIAALTTEGNLARTLYDSTKKTISDAINETYALAGANGVWLNSSTGTNNIFSLSQSGLNTDYQSIGYTVGNEGGVSSFKNSFYQQGGVYDRTYGLANQYTQAYQELQAKRQAIIDLGGIPTFATGGTHLGGIRLVGENGPELEVTGASRIFNAQQTQKILKGATNQSSIDQNLVKELINEVRALRNENNQLLSQIKNSSKEQAEIARKQSVIGVTIDNTTPVIVQVKA